MAKATPITMEMFEIMLTKVTEKFTESINLMIKEFTKCITESVSSQISALECRLKNTFSPDQQQATPVSLTASISEAVSKTLMEIDQQREEARVRASNVVITGLPPQSGVSDTVLFEKFCEENLTVKPRIVRTKRLGRGSNPRATAKLCVTVDSPESAADVIDSASILRHSTTFKHVYLNRDLSKAQAEAAYEARCRRRGIQPRGGGTAGAVPVAFSSSSAMSQPFSGRN